MLRPVLNPVTRIVFTCIVAATVLCSAAPPAHSRKKPQVKTVASRKTPPPPQTAAQLQQSLAADLHSGVFANDSVQVQIEGQDIHLSGVVHSAEHKGLATRQARLLASKGGWTSFHVINQISVNLPPLQ